MKLDIINLEKNIEESVDLPEQFGEEIQPDLIARAVIILQLNKRQPYGAKLSAGTRASSQLSRRRKKYRGSYGKGISRVPRKIMRRRGAQMYMVGAQAPGTVGGRKAHPPKPFKDLEKKINRKEEKKAVRSALAAVMRPELSEKRGHKVPEGWPFAVADSFSDLSKTKDAEKALQTLGFSEELQRASRKKIRAGKGKARGRKYVKKTGPLIVVAEACSLQKSASNIPGVDVSLLKDLNAEMLAPGTVPGRLTVFTKSAIEKMKKERAFQ